MQTPPPYLQTQLDVPVKQFLALRFAKSSPFELSGMTEHAASRVKHHRLTRSSRCRLQPHQLPVFTLLLSSSGLPLPNHMTDAHHLLPHSATGLERLSEDGIYRPLSLHAAVGVGETLSDRRILAVADAAKRKLRRNK